MRDTEKFPEDKAQKERKVTCVRGGWIEGSLIGVEDRVGGPRGNNFEDCWGWSTTDLMYKVCRKSSVVKKELED